MADLPTEHQRLALILGQDLARELSSRTLLFHQAIADRVGVSVADYRCLETLQRAEREGPVTAGQLAQHIGLTTGAVTGTLDRLEKAGFVQRVRDPSDRRQVFVRTVPERMQELDRSFEPFNRAWGELCVRYSEQELGLVQDFFTRAITLIQHETEQLRAGTAASAEPAGAELAELSAPLGGAERGVFEVVGGASSLTFLSGTGPFLYRARVTGPAPRLTAQGGRVTLEYSRSAFRLFDWRRHSVEVTLNRAIPWSIRVKGGMSRLKAELADVELEAVEAQGGASDVSLVLGPARGTAPVRIAGGASNVSVLRPQGVPARIVVHTGASSLTLDTLRLGAVGGETRWESPDYAGAEDRYDVDVSGGASGLTLSTHSP